jgi:hypothetical protein
MIRIRVVLVALATAMMVLFFAVPALAYGPGGLIGEGTTDIKEGHQFIKEGQMLIALFQIQQGDRLVKKGNEVIREGNQDISMGQRGGHGS